MTTTPAKPKTDLERLMDRMQRAARELEDAANRAVDAVGEVESCLMHDDVDGSELDLRELVGELHDAEHEGPQRFCSREACREAWETRTT